ncbi:MAG TPA: hypothetical protein VGG23_10385 [Acidimicrobiales bacterium]
MSYVDAGYSICLTVLFLYGVSLILRRRRLLRAADVADRDEAGLEVADLDVANRPATAVPAGTVPDGVAEVDGGDDR